jgi:hypothetical protein
MRRMKKEARVEMRHRRFGVNSPTIDPNKNSSTSAVLNNSSTVSDTERVLRSKSMKNIPRWQGSGLFLMVVMCSSALYAALGGDASSIAADQTHMKAQRRVSQVAGYTRHDMQDANGISVREYVSPQGKVFGVAWDGPSHPDLQQVLGDYYPQLMKNVPRRRVHGPVTIQVPGFVLQSGGHQRALSGRAYIPEMVPSGVNVEEIK